MSRRIDGLQLAYMGKAARLTVTSHSNAEINMQATTDDVNRAVLNAASHVFDECLIKIKHCLDQLSDEQVWWRPREKMNSIGNLLLHLTGNVRQWIIAGVGTSNDVRNRSAEFSEKGPIPKAELLQQLSQVVAEAKSVLTDATAVGMLQIRPIQGFEITGWEAIFDCLPHFKGHTQEIICLTRMQLGEAYQFHWQPETPEQGA